MAFQYRPLNKEAHEIRVLTVKPCLAASKGLLQGICASLRMDMLDCSTTHISLDASDRASYETISYVWGDPKPCRAIRVNGQVLMVPRNTETALRRMTFPDRSRVLWIDAVCINQADVHERGSQVALMGRIYSGCAGNLIYLGPWTRKTSAACDLITTYRATIQSELGNQSISAWLRESQDRQHRDFGSVPAESSSTWAMHFGRFLAMQTFPAAGWILPDRKFLESFYNHASAIEHLMKTNPWFRRTWVLQEAVLANRNEYFLGDQTFPLDHLLEVVAWLKMTRSIYLHLRFRFSDGVRAVMTLLEVRSTYDRQGFVEPSMLLNIGRQRKASDLRDKAFGMLGLAQNILEQLPSFAAPDYNKSAQEVFRDATRAALLSNVNGLEALSQISGGRDPLEPAMDLAMEFKNSPRIEKDDDRRPSWVPDWLNYKLDRAPPSTVLEGWSWDGWQPLPSLPATSEKLSDAQIEDLKPGGRPEILVLHGCVLGTVRDVAEVFNFQSKELFALSSTMVAGFMATPGAIERADPDRCARMFVAMCASCYKITTEFTEDLLGDWAFSQNSVDKWQTRLARVLMADTDLWGARSSSSDLTRYRNFEKAAQGPTDANEADFWEAARRASECRRLAKTDSNLLGPAPCDTEPGDLVVRFHGGTYPFILRSVSHEEYIIIEACYVEGGMPWQADDDDIAERLQSLEMQKFHVR